jgi:4-carboxymuconolactone decarboxylase
VDDYRQTLRRLALHDDRLIDQILASAGRGAAPPGLDARALALVRLGALIAVDAQPPAYMSTVEQALRAGVDRAEIVATLFAAMPVVGAPRVVSAAANIALALGYDVAAALEAVEGDDA